MKRVIITGANGFIGTSLVQRFVAQDIEVIALDKSFQNTRIQDSVLVTKIVSSLENLDDLRLNLAGKDYDAFYHLAWRGVNGSDKADPLVQLSNIQVSIQCVALAKELGCKRFLCAGTVAEQAIHSLPTLEKTFGGMMYGTTKHCTHLMLETYCKNIGIDLVWMQFSNIYGPSNKTGNLVSYTISQLINDQPATFGPAIQPYDFIYVDDLIEAVVRLGSAPVEQTVYFIGSGVPRPLKEYLLEIGEKMDKGHLIEIGVRADDGIKYTTEMFDIGATQKAIGKYVSMDFSSAIQYTIEHY